VTGAEGEDRRGAQVVEQGVQCDGARAEEDQVPGVLELVQRDFGRPLFAARMSERKPTAHLRVAAPRFTERHQRIRLFPDAHEKLCAGHDAQADLLGLHMSAHQAIDAVAVGHRHGRMPERVRALDELLWERCAFEKAVMGLDPERDVGARARHQSSRPCKNQRLRGWS
jgi:hypothetical protein